jgi:hypothetical protein
MTLQTTKECQKDQFYRNIPIMKIKSFKKIKKKKKKPYGRFGSCRTTTKEQNEVVKTTPKSLRGGRNHPQEPWRWLGHPIWPEGGFGHLTRPKRKIINNKKKNTKKV